MFPLVALDSANDLLTLDHCDAQIPDAGLCPNCFPVTNVRTPTLCSNTHSHKQQKNENHTRPRSHRTPPASR